MTTLPAIVAGIEHAREPAGRGGRPRLRAARRGHDGDGGPAFAPTATHAGSRGRRSRRLGAASAGGRGASRMSTARAVPGAIVTPSNAQAATGR